MSDPAMEATQGTGGEVNAAGEGPDHVTTFQEMRSTIEEKIDDLVFKTFKVRVYDSKEA